jgi:hypothetical protein
MEKYTSIPQPYKGHGTVVIIKLEDHQPKVEYFDHKNISGWKKHIKRYECKILGKFDGVNYGFLRLAQLWAIDSSNGKKPSLENILNIEAKN